MLDNQYLMLLFVLLTLLLALSHSLKQTTIPIAKSKPGNYYLELTTNETQESKILFEIDFNASNSYIDRSVLPSIEANQTRSVKVSSSSGEMLGELALIVLPANISWIEHKGRIGLGQNSTFMEMLERNYKKPMSLRFELSKQLVFVQQHKCSNPQASPYPISVSTWTTIDYFTPLSFNLHPSEDFLALFNSTQNNFKLPSTQYNNKTVDIKYSNQQKKVKVSKLLDCWSLDSADSYECDIKIGQGEVDVGRLLFEFPVRVCRDGVEIGGREQSMARGWSWLLTGIVGVAVIGVGIYLVKVKGLIEESRAKGKYSYNPPSWIEEEVEDILESNDHI